MREMEVAQFESCKNNSLLRHHGEIGTMDSGPDIARTSIVKG
jgi:hypothetical protein